jgi:hypothetical protein
VTGDASVFCIGLAPRLMDPPVWNSMLKKVEQEVVFSQKDFVLSSFALVGASIIQ